MENKENVNKTEFQTMYHKYIPRQKSMNICDDRLQSDCSYCNEFNKPSIPCTSLGGRSYLCFSGLYKKKDSNTEPYKDVAGAQISCEQKPSINWQVLAR